MNKNKLTTKTKIAVWWLIVIGVVLTIWHLAASFMSLIYSLDAGPVDEKEINLVFVLLLGSIFYILSGISLSRKSKRAWAVAVTILSIITICSMGIYLYISDYAYYSRIPCIKIPIILLLGFFIYLTPLILVILDRKNYFEMVRQLELSKKEIG